MKMYRLIAVGFFLAAFAVVTASAQTRPAGTAAAPQANALAADGKIALVYSELFQDQKNGIARINVTMGALNREFQPRQTELNQLAQKIQQLTDELQKNQGGDPKVLQAKVDQLDEMKKDYQRKGEDGKASYKKRKDDLFAPVQDDIIKALGVYAKAHGISVLIDGSAVPLAYVADAIDITVAFINDYNSKNPATALLNAPK
jgi:Skp family chaperone for outer membrane proteins